MKEEKIKNKTELSVSFLKGNYPFRSYNSQLLPGWDLAACINILKRSAWQDSARTFGLWDGFCSLLRRHSVRLRWAAPSQHSTCWRVAAELLQARPRGLLRLTQPHGTGVRADGGGWLQLICPWVLWCVWDETLNLQNSDCLTLGPALLISQTGTFRPCFSSLLQMKKPASDCLNSYDMASNDVRRSTWTTARFCCHIYSHMTVENPKTPFSSRWESAPLLKLEAQGGVWCTCSLWLHVQFHT